MSSYLSPMEVFSKKLTYGCSSMLNDEVPWEKVTSCQKNGVPTMLPKKARVGQKWHFFGFSSWDTAAIEMRCTFSPGNWSFNAELQMKVGFLKTYPTGRGMAGGLISRLWGNRDWKLKDGISKREQKLPTFFTFFFDSKLNVDHDFAIKHDLTQRFDQVMVVRS